MKLTSFDLNLLKVLDALLIDGSTTRAAERIGLSQPAVSAALGRLRAALGDPLFVRDGSVLAPTTFARSLREPIRAHMDGLAQTLAGMDAFDPAECTASFRVSGSDYFSVMLLPKLMRRLGQRAPKIKLSFVDLVHAGNVHEMGKLDVDIALPCTFEPPKNVASKPMFWSQWQVIARAGHPRLKSANIADTNEIPMELYCDLDHIVFSADGQHGGEEDKKLAQQNLSRHVSLAVGSFRDIYESVAESDLVALIPKSLAMAVAGRFGLSTHPTPIALEPALLWMAWNRWQSDDPAHKWLRSEISELLLHLNDVDCPLPNMDLAAEIAAE